MILQAVLYAALGAFVVVVLSMVTLAARRWWLQRSGGTFDCSLRLEKDPSTEPSWVLGVARYTGDEIQWFRVFSFSPRPYRVFVRSELEVIDKREPLASEALGLYDGHVIVEVVEIGRKVEFAMGEDALTGFMAWLEAAPPGKARSPL
jgi:hypothetical protein